MTSNLWLKEKFGDSVVAMTASDDLFIRSEKSIGLDENGEEILNIFMFDKKEALELAKFINEKFSKED